MNRRSMFSRVAVVTSLVCGLASLGCGRAQPVPRIATTRPDAKSNPANLLPPIELPQPGQRLGTAVVIVIDTSGSMEQTVRDQAGHNRPKHEISREALQKIIQFTSAWQAKHPETPLYFGINSFSGVTAEVLPMELFDSKKATAAIANIPRPVGGTAIGKALASGFVSLYSTGCVRKHLVCITDGNNTVGTPPDLMARQLYSQTQGEVEMHFVAFDTSANHFGFLKSTGGTAVEAADGVQLQARLKDIYEKRIFAEAMPAEKE